MNYDPWQITTCSMQLEASNSLYMSSHQSLRVGQNLYEDGHISYLRTDSVRISDEAAAAARGFIEANYGENYISKRPAAG